MVDALFPVTQIGAQNGAPIAHAKEKFARFPKKAQNRFCRIHARQRAHMFVNWRPLHECTFNSQVIECENRANSRIDYRKSIMPARLRHA